MWGGGGSDEGNVVVYFHGLFIECFLWSFSSCKVHFFSYNFICHYHIDYFAKPSTCIRNKYPCETIARQITRSNSIHNKDWMGLQKYILYERFK